MGEVNERFRKRVWIGWTLLRIGIRVTVMLAVALFLGGMGFTMFRTGYWTVGIALMLLAAALIGEMGGQLLALRRDVRLGIRQELRRRNFCMHCGYDLRASKGRCPECGTAVPRADTVEV